MFFIKFNLGLRFLFIFNNPNKKNLKVFQTTKFIKERNVNMGRGIHDQKKKGVKNHV
jgi:hypothetical protein